MTDDVALVLGALEGFQRQECGCCYLFPTANIGSIRPDRKALITPESVVRLMHGEAPHPHTTPHNEKGHWDWRWAPCGAIHWHWRRWNEQWGDEDWRKKLEDVKRRVG